MQEGDEHALKKLRPFNMNSKMLEIRVLWQVQCIWSAGETALELVTPTDKLIRNTGFVANWTIEAVVERRSLNKVLFIMGNPAQEVEHLL